MDHPAQVIVFDLDDTLAPSKSPLPEPIADLLMRLLEHIDVCVISGAGFEQFDRQVLDRLPEQETLGRLHLMPTCGTRYYRWRDGSWVEEYAHDLDAAQRGRVLTVLREGAEHLGLWETRTWGPVLEDRGSQVTFSALGQSAPVDVKSEWDPDGSKKELLRAYASDRLPDLAVRSGGSTSVDVTRQGIDKAYGVRELCQMLGIDTSAVLFVGDRLDPSGNDYPVVELGVECVRVANWHETAAWLARHLDELAAAPAHSPAP